jgi:hypothetical protein
MKIKIVNILILVSIFLLFTSVSFASDEIISNNIENAVEQEAINYAEMEFEEGSTYSEEDFIYEISEKSNSSDQVVESVSNSKQSSTTKTITTGMNIHNNQVYQTEQLVVYVTDGNGNRLTLNNQPITFNVNGVNYVRNTDSYGLASLTLNLNAQSNPYTVYLTFNGYGNYAAFYGYIPVYVVQKVSSLTRL